MSEFMAWLQDHEAKLKTYTDDEIANLAVACGFSRAEIAQWQTQRKFRSVA